MSVKYIAVYNVLEIARGHAPEKTLREYIKDLILVNDSDLWSLMEPNFVPPGKEGRRDYDHAEAIAHIKNASQAYAKDKKMPDPLKGLNTAILVPHVLKVLQMIGFVVKNGKIVSTKQEIEDTVNGVPVVDVEDTEDADERVAA